MAWAPGAQLLLDASTPAWADPGRLFVGRRNGFAVVGPEVNAGIAPATGCVQATDVGKRALVPYTADYFFYKAAKGHTNDDD